MNKQAPVIQLTNVSLHYGKTRALDNINLTIPAGCMVALIGPDGVGKSSMLSLISGAHAIDEGDVFVLDGDMRDKEHRRLVCPRIAYMPQGLGKNLYPTLSVEENLQFFGRLFGLDAKERRRRIDDLCQSTGLLPFLDRPAGKLSGGMKQKLGLCCALIHDPDLLILDEPTTGVDPLARAQFWQLINRIRAGQPNMSVLVATAYMDEAQKFDWLIAMNDGKILATDTAENILKQTHCNTLEDAFIYLLPEEVRAGHKPVEIEPLTEDIDSAEIAIEAKDLTVKFGQFTAVNNVSFRIRRGEIFGFLGSNGCGKSTTMKMLTGLLAPTSGEAWLFGQKVDANDINTRKRVGYMTQAFSLYSELTVRQNLQLHAELFHIPKEKQAARVDEMIDRFDLTHVAESLPDDLPLGIRQRLSLAVAMVHQPEMLILDEPTSGVDPLARDNFWRLLIDLSRKDKVTIFITTHFMNEALRCDRISLMHAGKVLVSDTPQAIIEHQDAKDLETAFIRYLEQAGAGQDMPEESEVDLANQKQSNESHPKAPERFSLERLWSYLWREALELKRDPIRASLALIGSLLLMLVMGYGISMDVNNINFAILDRDQSVLSQLYAENIAGSDYFVEKSILTSYDDLDRRLQSGEISAAIEIPRDFAKDFQQGKPTSIGVWVDASMPQRAENVRGYIQGMHQVWLTQQQKGKDAVQLTDLATRFRYNPDIKSLPAMVPAIIPILLLMIPAILTTLAVVKEKELGSIINLYVTPVSRVEFLLGKQIPYVILAMFNFGLMVLLAVTLFDVPIKGNGLALTVASFCFCFISTGLGLLISTFTRSQIAAMFLTLIATMMPAIQFSGMINPVNSLEGTGRLVGTFYPATDMLTISRGVFCKALGFSELGSATLYLLTLVPIILIITISFLKKQES